MGMTGAGIDITLGSAPRLPPSNHKAEQGLLGAILANNKAYHDVSDILKAEYFVDPVHQRIYAMLSEVIEAGRLADALTLSQRFGDTGILKEVGGTKYLTELLTANVSPRVAPEYADVVRDTWSRREMIAIGQDLVSGAFSGDAPSIDLATTSASSLDALSFLSHQQKGTSWADAVEAAFVAGLDARQQKEVKGVFTGLSQLDEILGCLEPAGIYVVAGRPGSGKSALALQIGIQNARRGIPVIYFSTEMLAKQLGRRMLSWFTGVPAKALKRGAWSESQADALREALVKIDAVRDAFVIEDVSGLNTRIIGARTREFVRKAHKAARDKAKNTDEKPFLGGLIIVDHMHDLGEFADNTTIAAVISIVQALKGVAKKAQWPMLLCAQMSRKGDDRETRRPEMGDLYGGMQIEAIAEGIILLDRPDKRLDPFEPEAKPGQSTDKARDALLKWRADWEKWRDVVLAYVPKVRDGETGMATMKFHGASNRFSNHTMAQGALGQ